MPENKPTTPGRKTSEQENFDDILRRIYDITETRTQTQLVTFLGIRQTCISDAKKRRSIPPEWLLKLLEAKNVSPHWIRSGKSPVYWEGPSIRNKTEYTLPAPNSKNTFLQKATLVPVFRLDGDAFPSPDAPAGKPAGNMALPAWFTDGVTVGLVGDASMEPLPGEGAYVGIATADTAFRNGAIFAVRTARAGVIVRRAYMDAEEAHIVLRANDPGCPPLRLDRQEFSRRVAGRVAWTLQRMG